MAQIGSDVWPKSVRWHHQLWSGRSAESVRLRDQRWSPMSSETVSLCDQLWCAMSWEPWVCVIDEALETPWSGSPRWLRPVIVCHWLGCTAGWSKSGASHKTGSREKPWSALWAVLIGSDVWPKSDQTSGRNPFSTTARWQVRIPGCSEVIRFWQ